MVRHRPRHLRTGPPELQTYGNIRRRHRTWKSMFAKSADMFTTQPLAIRTMPSSREQPLRICRTIGSAPSVVRVRMNSHQLSSSGGEEEPAKKDPISRSSQNNRTRTCPCPGEGAEGCAAVQDLSGGLDEPHRHRAAGRPAEELRRKLVNAVQCGDHNDLFREGESPKADHRTAK